MADRFVMPILPQAKNDGTFTWEPTDAHRAQAQRNHGQTFERMRERGGMAWIELYWAIAGLKHGATVHDAAATATAKAWLLAKYPQG